MTESAHHTLAPGTRVVASRHQLSTHISGEAVILGLRDSVYYGLAGSGARIWELIREPAALRDVAAVVSREFEVDEPRATADLITLANDLLARGLIEVVPDAAS
jgi:hypothetical protein